MNALKEVKKREKRYEIDCICPDRFHFTERNYNSGKTVKKNHDKNKDNDIIYW